MPASACRILGSCRPSSPGPSPRDAALLTAIARSDKDRDGGEAEKEPSCADATLALIAEGPIEELQRGSSFMVHTVRKQPERHPTLRREAEVAFQKGRRYDTRGSRNMGRALRWLHRAARSGHADAQNYLGEVLRDDYREYAGAVSWFRPAAEQGHSAAQVNLGRAYFVGEGVRRDVKQARRWYLAAARQGNPRAMYNLGQMYRTGEGVQQSWAAALRWYRRAAKKGHAGAQYWLGRIYGGDESYAKRNDVEAVKWFRRAARAGDADAMCSLGVHYHEGLGVRRDHRKAAQLYRTAARAGNSWAQYLLGLCYRDGHGVSRNGWAAISWLRKSASAGQREARRALRRLHDGSCRGAW